MDEHEIWAGRWKMTSSGERCPQFVGLALGAAEETAAENGMTVRVFGPPTDIRTPFNANFRLNHLNRLVREGVVVDAVAS